LLPRTSNVIDLCTELAKCVKLTPNGTNKIRVFQISKDGKRQEEYTGNEMIGNIHDNTELFAEEVPQEELDALSVPERDKIIMVYHFYREPSRAHGVPFRFVIKPGEKFADTKKRLVTRLQVHEKDWSKFRFALIQEATFKQPTHISDEDILYDHKWLAEDVLGLDHMDKSNKRANGAYKNDAIVIKG